MNICTICQADGVLLIAGKWFCVNHVDDGFLYAARVVARIKGHDEELAERKAEAWLNDQT